MPKSKIYYFCFSHNHPRGGQKHAYRHVDILNKYGYEALVFHPTDNFRLTWFENDTRVIGLSEFKERFDPSRDYIVLPEDLGTKISGFPGRKVIFNKNLFYGFQAYGFETTVSYPYHSPDVVSVLTVSDHNTAHLRFAYPHLMVQRVYLEIQPDTFPNRPLAAKKPQIVCVRKGLESLSVLYHILQSRSAMGLNRGRLFQWIFLGSKSERETSQILQESILFVFTSLAEGLGRMPLEAMSCGCLVAAYGCGPLKETIPSAMQFESGNILEMAKFIERVMESFPNDLAQWDDLVAVGSRVAGTFSIERQEQSVIAAWEKILSQSKPKLDNSLHSLIKSAP